jgi:lysophospholipase L1-like esterase
MERIAIWGDSITYGASDYEKGGWANRLMMFFSKDDVGVYNLGISGDRTYDLVDRFEGECEIRKPDVILFAIGTNDSQYVGTRENPSTSLEKFRDNLQWLIDTARKCSKKIGFVGLTKVDESKVTPWGEDSYYDNENVMKYDAVVKDVCESNGLPYLYMFDLLDEGDLWDGLHPNAQGHEKMFLRVRDFVGEEFG